MMNWDDLRYVLAVGRAGSLSGAARALDVNHSTVFRRLGAIESRLGVRLFERFRDGYGLTPAGEEICRVAERLDDDVSAVERRVAGRDTRPSGTIRVTTTDTLLIPLLTPHFTAFRAAHPLIDLEVIVSNAFLNLSKRDADVAIRPSNDPPGALVGRRVAGIATAIYGATAHLPATNRRLDPAGMTWIAPDDSLAHLPAVRWLATTLPSADIGYRCNTLLGMLAAVKSGLGIAPLPCFLADPEPELRRVRAPLPELESELWLLTHADLRRVARIRAFLDFMAGRLAAQRRLLEGRLARGR